MKSKISAILIFISLILSAIGGATQNKLIMVLAVVGLTSVLVINRKEMKC